ncbi:MAG: MFS transporter [Selenomonas sp.]|nr:MFS transporter [Selenomonadales bacterium]MDD7763344.1 MFS transporter [Selenomonadales bacterium]MDY5716566.1 MFS transporter [Selenomonas sp.]
MYQRTSTSELDRELSIEAGITSDDAAEILQASHCLTPIHYRFFTRKEIHSTMSTATAPATSPTKLWTRNYIFDIGVNFLVYCVHFLLMLWSTAYAIHTWNASIGMAGLASGLFIVGALFARIPAGRFIDFVGRRKMFLGGTAFFFLLVLLYEMAPTLELFMVVRFLHGVSFGTTSTASSTVVAALVPLKRMGTGIGYFTLGVTMASAVGPFLAMNITQAGNFSLGIEICTAATFVIFLLAFGIKTPERVILDEEKRDLKHLSFDRFFSIKALAISTIALMGGVCYSTVLSFLGAYTNSIGVTGIGATCFFLCFAFTSFISRPLTGFLLDKYGGNVVIYPSLACMAIAMGIIATATSDIPLLIGALFLGFGYGTITASCHALAVHCAPMHQVGVATSTYFVLLDFGIGVGPYTLGSFVPTFGFSFVYFAAGALSIAGMALYFYLIGRHHRFTRHQMDRVSEAKEIVEKRRQHFYQQRLLAMHNH